MQTTILAAHLKALVFAVWAAMGPLWARAPGAGPIADAVVATEVADAARPPVFGSHDEDAAVMAYWAAKESSLRLGALGDGGKSRGPWQLQGPCGTRPLRTQAACWLSMLRRGARLCPGAPGAILWGVGTDSRGRPRCDLPVPGWPGWTVDRAARRRVERARALLVLALGKLAEQDANRGLAEPQPPAVE